MIDAVIVSTARTGLAKSWKGAFNTTHGATLGGHVLHPAIARADRHKPPIRRKVQTIGCGPFRRAHSGLREQV